VSHIPYLLAIGEPAAGLLGPDVSSAPNGSTLTMAGDGQLDAVPDKSVSGGGSYMIPDASGATVASGYWTATKMLSFVNYGSASAQGLPANLYGGQAQMMVNLDGLGSGVLNINCTLGTPPPGHSGDMEEGIDLQLGNGLTFNREVFGQTIFINLAQVP
jgi:hypothetical protein